MAGAIPGTEAITKKIQNWQKVNTQEFTDVQNSLQRASDQAGHSHRKLQGTIEGLSAAWKGKDADSYRGYMQTFADASKAAHQLLDEGVTSIKDAVTKLDEAKREMQTAIDDMHNMYDRAMKTAHGPNGGPPNDDQKRTAGQQAANAVKGKVDAAENKAKSAMQALSSALGNQTSNMRSTYANVPSPGTTSTSGAPMNSTPVSYSSGSGGNYSGASGSAGASGGPPAGGPPPGNVQQWIDKAIQVLKQNGVNVSEADKQTIWQMIQHESGGDPHAINNWDSNAAKGTPSKGLMQCIDPTFNAHKLPGHGDIYNPVDNICAGVRYSLDRYGSLSDVPGIKSMAGGGGYQGY